MTINSLMRKPIEKWVLYKRKKKVMYSKNENVTGCRQIKLVQSVLAQLNTKLLSKTSNEKG